MAEAALDFGAMLVALGAGLVAALAAILLLEVLASFLPASEAASSDSGDIRIAVLVPAHNEALLIQSTLGKILPELSPEDRLIVIADNCNDQTATLARQAGAEVILRNQPELRGKGYALDFGVRHLEADASGVMPDVVICMDADCWSEPRALRRLAAAAANTGRPVQAFYDLEPPPRRDHADSYLSVASLAWSTKNFVRPLGLHRLGLPCQLMGTGMAFPWTVIAGAKLKTPNIVEDLALGLDLAGTGNAAQFLPTARVISHFPVSVEGQQTQRTRWEAGHLQTITRVLPALLLRSIRQTNGKLFVLAADAAVPPLTLFLTWVMAILVMSLILASAGGSLIPGSIAVAALLATGASIFLAAARVGRLFALLSVMRRIPGYAASKVAIYKGAFCGKTISWNRSKRD